MPHTPMPRPRPPEGGNSASVVERADAVADILADDAFTWNGDIPWKSVKVLAENDLIGMNFDASSGGGGYSNHLTLSVIEAVTAACPDTGRFLTMQNFAAPCFIDRFGSESVREQYLPAVLDGSSLIAIGATEAHAGSDMTRMNTAVEPEGDGFVLNGEKRWVTMATDADAVMVWAQFSNGIGAVVVDMDAAGIDVVDVSTNMASDEQVHLRFEDVAIPPGQVLLEGGDGSLNTILASHNWKRLAVAAFANGVGRCAVRKALAYAQTREQFGKPIYEFQGLQWEIADCVADLEAVRALVHQYAADAEASDIPDPMHAAIAKLQSVKAAENAADTTLQVHGARGYQDTHPAAYLYRLIRGFRIGGGTDEILKDTISSFLPDEPFYTS